MGCITFYALCTINNCINVVGTVVVNLVNNNEDGSDDAIAALAVSCFLGLFNTAFSITQII
jgi:hypothetical protein